MGRPAYPKTLMFCLSDSKGAGEGKGSLYVGILQSPGQSDVTLDKLASLLYSGNDKLDEKVKNHYSKVRLTVTKVW